jgi:hypothetical protein
MTSADRETHKDDKIKCEKVTNQNATKFTAGLCLYSIQEGNEGSPISASETCADFAQLQSIKRIQHGTFN